MTCSSLGELVASGVPDDMLYALWPQLWPLLKPAYERSKEKTDLLAGILSKELQLWAIFDKQNPVAGICTKLLRDRTSGDLQLRVWLVGGSRLKDWLPDFLSKAMPWARAEGCSAITGSGRRGWKRVAARLGCVRVEDEDGEPCWSLPI